MTKHVTALFYCHKTFTIQMASKSMTVIAGILEDPSFNHLCFIADHLTKALPNFHYKSICKHRIDWKPWLQKICTLYGWSHYNSPLVWKEIGITHTNITYVGGASQFWELLHKNYNVTTNLSKEDIEDLCSDLLLFHKSTEKPDNIEAEGQYRRITIIGAGRSLCPDLIPQLITINELWLSQGVIVNLYDEPGRYFKIKRIVKDMEAIGCGLHIANVIERVSDGLQNCDILIYLDALAREDCESIDSWLNRNYKLMEKFSEDVNNFAPPHVKIIFCSSGATCFCVNVIHTLVKNVPKANIVAVSSHYGLEIIYPFINALDLKVTEFGCPPVWGFLGINRYVDVCHMVQKHNLLRPNERAVRAHTNTTLPLGVKQSELRWFSYMSYNKDPYKYYYQRKATVQYQVGRTEHFQMCRAICDLLKLWFTKKLEIGDEIISLGISSNGTFGIPEGLVFSQPVYLTTTKDNARVWVPFTDFPLPDIPKVVFENLIHTATLITQRLIENRDNTKAKNVSTSND